MSYIEVFVRKFVPWMFAVAICANTPSCLFADSTSASLSITVADTSGAVIPDATATLRNSDTSQQQSSASNRTGNASFAFLKPGHYTLMVSKEGFSDVAVTGILLNVGDDKHIQLVLKVGSANQNITVDGSGVTLNTTDGSVSTVVDRQFVANIPLNGRSFQDLISMTPGVLTGSPQSSPAIGYTGDFSVNGQRTEANYYTVDGVTGNIAAGNGYGGPQPANAGGVAASTALGTTQSLLSVDALQEFRVASSTYSAEFGRSPGAQFSLVTRSGTNDVHGTAFDYFRNDIFDANDWFNDQQGQPKPPLRQNDFGGTFGGPLRIPHLYDGKNRSFFFFSYEGLRLSLPQAASVQYVPDSYLRQQAPAALQPILNGFPVQTGTDYGSATAPGLAVFAKSYSLPSRIDATSLRLDHTVSPKLALFLRANYAPSSTSSRVLSEITNQIINTEMYTLGATSQFSSRFSNEFRIGYGGSASSLASNLDSFGGAQPTDLQKAMAGQDYGASSSMAAEFQFSGAGKSEIRTQTTTNNSQQWNVIDTANWSRGRHQIKTGIDYLNVRAGLTPGSPGVTAAYISGSEVLSNQALFGILSRSLGSTPVFGYLAAFVQDDWRITPRLSLSGGIRWEVDPPPHEAHGNDAYTLTGSPSNPSSLALAPQGTPLWKTTYLNFAPRFGIAWQAHTTPGKETVVRAGGGAFFDSDNATATQGYSSNAIGLSATSFNFGTSLPVTPAQLNLSTAPIPPFTQSSAYAFPAHLQLPYTIQWNASVEQSLGEHQSFTLSYVAASGRRLIGEQEYSFSRAQSPIFQDGVYLFNANLTSSYNALQAKFQRSVGHGLQALVSYSWSHSIDYGSQALALPTTRGNSDFDVRQNASAGATWDLPSATHSGLLSMIVKNWGLDGRLIARTAFPITINGNFLTTSSGQEYYGGVNFVSGQPNYLYSSLYPGGRALNPAAFVANASATANGNVPRNYFRGFDEMQVNLSLRRTAHITESTSLQFHADAFNIPNHPNFGAIDTYLYDALFGQAIQSLNQSLATMASQYQQGGPRSFQFSLKLLF